MVGIITVTSESITYNGIVGWHECAGCTLQLLETAAHYTIKIRQNNACVDDGLENDSIEFGIVRLLQYLSDISIHPSTCPVDCSQ